jgi:hypothetical protein
MVCVLCGKPWEPQHKNVCSCGGICTWGKKKGDEPLSWKDYYRGIPNHPSSKHLPDEKEEV